MNSNAKYPAFLLSCFSWIGPSFCGCCFIHGFQWDLKAWNEPPTSVRTGVHCRRLGDLFVAWGSYEFSQVPCWHCLPDESSCLLSSVKRLTGSDFKDCRKLRALNWIAAQCCIKSVRSVGQYLNYEPCFSIYIVINSLMQNQIESRAIEELPVESVGVVNPAALILLGLIAIAGLWSFSLLLEYLVPD